MEWQIRKMPQPQRYQYKKWLKMRFIDWNQNPSIQLSCNFRAGYTNRTGHLNVRWQSKNLRIFRTDAGVHALNSTAHIDLERGSGAPYYPMTIVTKLNYIFGRWKEPIRILNAQLVGPDFSARRDANNRTYLYRLAVHRHRYDSSLTKQQALYNLFIPIEENRRCHFIL